MFLSRSAGSIVATGDAFEGDGFVSKDVWLVAAAAAAAAAGGTADAADAADAADINDAAGIAAGLTAAAAKAVDGIPGGGGSIADTIRK
jgi:hypothetical protein